MVGHPADGAGRVSAAVSLPGRLPGGNRLGAIRKEIGEMGAAISSEGDSLVSHQRPLGYNSCGRNDNAIARSFSTAARSPQVVGGTSRRLADDAGRRLVPETPAALCGRTARPPGNL